MSLFGQKAHSVVLDLSDNRIVRIVLWKYHTNTEQNWQKQGFDDSSWKEITAAEGLNLNPGVHSYRTNILLENKLAETDFLALYLPGLVSAYEVYWDGDLVASNGTVGLNEAEEIGGTINNTIKIRQSLTTPGHHVLAVRVSDFIEQSPQNIFFVQLGYYSEIQSRLNVRSYWFQFSAGLFLLASIFSFALFLGGGRNRSYFLFAIYCMLNVLYAALAFLLNYLTISITYLPLYNLLFYLIAPLAIIFLNVFFLYNYDLRYRNRHILINVVLSVTILLLFGYNFIVYLSLYAVYLVYLAILKKEPGSVIAFAGTSVFVLLLILFANGLIFQLYNMGEVFFVFCITLSISYQIRKQNQQLEESKMRSARLEAELLKKNIQPHFLMNTLLSIISWIEENPPTAQKLIQALSDEFKLINKISAEKEIPIKDEIGLCKSHLAVMGFRKDAEYDLIQENIPEYIKIPPMIFHTLIENGLTHAFRTGENGTFTISFNKDAEKNIFVMKNDGSLLQKFSNRSPNQIHEGMGLKYIKTRLEESYPGRWEMFYGMNNDLWEVRIEIVEM